MPGNSRGGKATGSSAKPAKPAVKSAKGRANAFAFDQDDNDDVPQPSQSSSDDGLMATIAQQMQLSMEKKKKEKEGRVLQNAQKELIRIIRDKAQEFTDMAAGLDQIFEAFQLEYATNEDTIRKLWEAILKEQLKLHKIIEEKQKKASEYEQQREQKHIKALALGRKACEESNRLINSLNPHGGFD
ncbi:hypothetical protein SCHPADRAFT_944781 [Schizopora paradoxa]|uniref:Uncharacterized protein n=1 Tax=Schizopora paradoxa TaxID=27342 RepID=A0A0H2RT87_9AGAM|nr:hypothetical protein SCHPADRAFT_944781 [Schizopora paradoxa]